MSVTVTERPHQYCFSENEVRYVFEISDPETPGCALEAQIYTYAADGVVGDAERLITLSNLVPNTDGKVYLYLEDYLKSLLAFKVPDASTAYTHAGDQYRKFYIKYRQVTTAAPSPDWEDDSDNVSTVLMGGIEAIKFSRNNYFIYHGQNLPWLTWQPSGRFVFDDQKVFLSFLNTGDEPTQYRMKVVAQTVGGQEVSAYYEITHTSGQRLFHMQVGLDFLGLDIPTDDTVHYYQVSIVDDTDVVLVNAYTFYVHHSTRYEVMEFSYHNSLGGMDSVAVRGDWDWELERNVNEVEQVADYDNWNTTARQGAFFHNQVSKRDMYKGDVGFVNSKLQQEAMIEMFISRSIWHLLSDNGDFRWVQVLNMQKNTKVRGTRDKIWSFPIEWSYPFNDNVFTPKGRMLGMGTL